MMQGTSSAWATIIQWSLWAILMAAIMAWVGRSRSRAPAPQESRRLVMPVSILVIGVTCFLFFAALTILSNVFANETTAWWTTAVFVGFALMGLWMIGSYFAERHDVSADGMTHRRLVGKARTFRWSDVARVRYSPSLKWFRLELRSGQVVRVTAMAMNLPMFARRLRHGASAQVDPATQHILRETEAGNPPPVWG